MMNRLTLVLAVVIAGMTLIVSGCATKWSDAPVTDFPNSKFVTKVSWVKAEQESSFEIIAAASGLRCCMIPADEIRNPVIDAAKKMASQLCGARQFHLENDAYDEASETYSTRLRCLE